MRTDKNGNPERYFIIRNHGKVLGDENDAAGIQNEINGVPKDTL